MSILGSKQKEAKMSKEEQNALLLSEMGLF
jgi:hypothetical protein